MLQNRDNNNKWRNPGFAIFFHISVLINLGLATFGVIQYKSELFHTNDMINLRPGFKDILFIFIVFGASILLTILWLLFMQSCAKAVIKFSLIFEAIIWLAISAISLFALGPIGVLIFIVFAAIRLFVVIWLWRYIHFCQTLFMVALSAFKQYWYPVFLHLALSIISFIILVADMLSFFTLSKLFPQQADPNHISVFSFGFIELVFIYWHFHALKNVCHMTSCGVMIQYLNKQTMNMWKKFKLSITKLFGVICFGTFIEAVLWALRVVLGQQEQAAARNGNILQCLCICCLRCLITLIGDILRFINSYTYVYAIKNETDYVTSAKSVFNMFVNTGFLSLINEWILYAPLHVGFFLLLVLNILFLSVATALGIIGKESGIACAAVGIGLGMMAYLLMMEVIRSYIKTVFVVWAEDRNIFATNQPGYSQILDDAVPAGALSSSNQNGNVNEFQVQ